MNIAIMFGTFRRAYACVAPYAGPFQTAEWLGRLKVKPGSLVAAESRPPSH